MKTNAQQVTEYTEQIARLELERAELNRSLENAIMRGVGHTDTIIWLSVQIVKLTERIGTLSAMRYVYEKEAPDADALLTVPF